LEENKISKDVENNSAVDSNPKRKRLRVGRIISLILIITIVILGLYWMKNFFPTGMSIAANVNGEAILMQELDNEYQSVPEVYRPFITKSSILEQMISEKLLLQEAKKNSIIVSDEKVDEEIENLRAQTGHSTENFEKLLIEQGISLEDFKAQYKKQLIITELLNKTIFNEIEITESDAKKFYDENRNLFQAGEAQIHASHILVSTEDEAKEIIRKLKNKNDFDELAKEYSVSPMSAKGGDLGFFTKEDMVKEFSDAAFALSVNEYTDKPVKTEFGYHVIKREPDKIPFNDVKEDIIQNLLSQKENTAVEIYLKQLKNNSNIDIKFKDDSDAPIISIDSEEVSLDENKKDLCFEKYGLNENSVIFYYLDSPKCPQCVDMLKTVKNLDQNYNIYYADISNENSLEVLKECFGDLLEGKAPLLICAGSKETKLGKYDSTQVKTFLENCN